MIPPDISDSIFPEIADGSEEAAVLQHDCGVDFLFRVEPLESDSYVIENHHLKSWRTKLTDVAAIGGGNCFSYNELEEDPAGVYRHDDGNTLAILFSPGTFLEHNPVQGSPVLLLVNERTCILTGSDNEAGMQMIQNNLESSISSSLLTIDKKWQNWIKFDISN